MSGSRPAPAGEDGPERTTDDLEHRIGKLSLEPADLSKDLILGRAPQSNFRGAPRPTIGKMILLARLGQGGMGVVYFGVHPRLGVEVAVKVLSVQGATAGHPEHVARFLREARLAARLRSDHLVSVLDVDQDETAGVHYIVMEYVRGMSANSWLESHRRAGLKTPEPEALDLCIAATRGLVAAHETGILHRDVKPDNILVPRGQDGSVVLRRAKLADLGLARPEEPGSTVTGAATAMGSPGFMAPEQVDGRVPASRASDVFGMGATLHALLAGESPFLGATPMHTIFRTVQDSRESIRKLRPDVSDPTALLIEKALAPDPAHRHADATEFLAALEACRAQFPASAAPAASPGGAAPTLVPLVEVEGSESETTFGSRPPDAAAPTAAWGASRPGTPDARTEAWDRSHPSAAGARTEAWSASRPPTPDTSLTPASASSSAGAPASPPPAARPTGTVVVPSPSPAAPTPAPPWPEASPEKSTKPRSKIPILVAVFVVAVIAVRAFLLSGKDEVAPTPPDGTKPTPQDPSKLPVVPDPPPTPPDPTAKAPPAPSDEEVLRREEESKRREASATQVAAAKTLLDAGRTAEALAAFLKLRSDANFAAAPAAADGVRESVRAVLAAADAKRAAGDLDGAAADLESLRALAGTGPSPALTPADGYDPALVSSRAETIRREQVARALRRTDQLVAEGKYEDALRELRQVGMNPAIREESARAAGDVLRAALRRARERDQAGEHKAAIDDFDLVLREKAALAADSSMDVPSITLDLAEACLAAGEWRRSESALDSLAGDDATAPRAVVLRGKSGLAKNGGDEWPADRRDRMTALPAEAKGREADDQLARGERALDRGAFDTATLDARVALLLVPRSTRAKYVLGAAAAKRIAAGRRRAADLETARNQLRTVVSEAAKAPSPEIEKLRTSAEALLKALPKE